MREKVKSMITDRWKNLSTVKKATIIFLLCTILQKTISIISTPIFTRLMSTSEYGQFTIYQSWLSLFSIITTFRLDYDVFNKGMTKYDDKNSYVSTMQTLSLIFTLVVLLLYMLFQNKFNLIIGLPSIVVFAILIELLFMSSISFWSLKERYEFKYKYFAIITILMSILNIIVGIVAVYFYSEKGIARIMSCVLIQIIFGVYFYYLNIVKAKKFFVLEYAKFAILFNIPLIPHYLSSYILNFADKLMIQKMIGLSEAGIYGVVYSAGLVMTMVSSALNNALIPWQYKSLQNERCEIIKQRVNEIMIVLAVSLTIFILFAPELMHLLAANEYYSGVYIIPPIASSVLFIFLYNLVCNAEFYYDKNKFTMIMSGVCAVLNVVLNLIFINLYGYMAAGYTTLFCYIFTAILHVIYLNNVTKDTCNSSLYDLKRIMFFVVYMVSVSILSAILYGFTYFRYLFVTIILIVLFLKRQKLIEVLKGR